VDSARPWLEAVHGNSALQRQTAPLTVTVTEFALACLAACGAALYVLSALSYIAAFSWRQLLFDQLQQYLPLLDDDLPQSLLVPSNGHRPFFPNLIRYADLVLGGADQRIPIAFGVLFALLSFGLVAFAAWRTKSLLLSERWATLLLAAIAIFWLGNSRMLLHANEAIQVHLATLAVIVSAACAWRAARKRPVLWMGIGSMAAFVATFSFGSGIAAFPALLLLGAMQRVEWRALALAAVMLIATLTLYLFVLPGDEGVREVLSLRPIDSALTTARWLSGPLVNGWLGLSDPLPGSWLRESVAAQEPGRMLVASANWAATRFGGRGFVHTAGAVIGSLGLAAAAGLTLVRVWRPRPLGFLENQAFALMLFGAAAGVVIGVARLAYFDQHPSQVFADRYGVWPCLFWLGLGTLLIIRNAAGATSSLRWTMPVLVLFVAVAAWPSHLGYRGWGAAVYRNAERGAAAIAMDVRDAPFLPAAAETTKPNFERVVELLRQRRLSMFATRSSAWIGARPPLRLEVPASIDRAAVRPTLLGSSGGRRLMSFHGRLLDGVSRSGLDELFVVDNTQRVVGLARWSFDPSPVPLGLVSRPQWRGFDGYIRSELDCAPLTLVGLRGTKGEALALFAPCAP